MRRIVQMALGGALLLAHGCGETEAGTVTPVDVVAPAAAEDEGGDTLSAADRAALAPLIDAERDPVVVGMRDVDRANEQDLPVRAADMLQQVVIPAANQQLERVQALTLASGPGRALQAEADTAFTARRDALVQYAAALERGIVEDMVLIDALRALRLANDQVLALHTAFEATGAR